MLTSQFLLSILHYYSKINNATITHECHDSNLRKNPSAGKYTLTDGKSQKYNKKEPLSRHFRILIIVLSWQGHKDLNPEPTVLETAALPIELYPYVNIKGVAARVVKWWAFRDSNPGLSGYEPEALTN